MLAKYKISLFLALMATGIMISCEKFLNEKPNTKLVIPGTLADLQSILDDQTLMNERQPSAGESSADDYYLNPADFKSLEENARNLYTWNKDNQFVTGSLNSWVSQYSQIYNCNLVLEGLNKISRSAGDQQNWNAVKGHALFCRSRSFFQIAQLWCLNYDEVRSEILQGIPLRLTSDFNIATTRSSLSQTYQQILQDFKEAASLLPNSPVHTSRPSKAAAYGFLGRVYLSMNQHDSCLKYTNLALAIKSDLMDYNGGPGVTPTAEFPFARFNPEVIYDLQMSVPLNLSNGIINKELYDSYKSEDLRKTMYHRGALAIGYFKGAYSGSTNLFSGLATDELYLMRSECLARADQVDEAMQVLNSLLVTRWKKTVPYINLTAIDKTEALNKILLERRKELFYRGLRWMDLKRLNRAGANITQKRELSGVFYTLLPNDRRYALAIPEDIINISGIAQNER